MTFSLIVPVYNGEKSLPGILRDFSGLTGDGFELLIIDDGSTDGTPELSKKAAAEDRRIRFFRTPNRGPGAARNEGLRCASGDAVLFIDADDRFDPEALLRVAGEFESRELDLLFTSSLIGENDASLHPLLQLPEEFPAETQEGVLTALFRSGSWWSVWGHVFRRKLLTEERLFLTEGIYAEDLEWTPRVVFSTRKTGISKERFYRHYRHDDTLSASGKMVYDLFCVTLGWLEKLAENPPLQRLFSAIFYANLYRFNSLTDKEKAEITPRFPKISAAGTGHDWLIAAALAVLGPERTAALLSCYHRIRAASRRRSESPRR